MATLDSTVPSTNGHANRIRLTKPVRKGLTSTGRSQRIRKAITVALGCGIPCLSLALSSIGGRLIVAANLALGIGFLGLCCTVLTVSLSHLAWAIRDITKSSAWQSLAMAIVIDCSLVACELAGVVGYEAWQVTAVMACVTATSAVLNCWGFTRHCK